MALTGFAAALLLAGCAASANAANAGAASLDKVINLLEELKKTIEAEGKKDAGTYDKFSCFCKDTTQEKSDAITENKDKIDGLSADIESQTAAQGGEESKVAKRQKDNEGLQSDLAASLSKCQKEAAEYEATAADLSKAIEALEGAIKAIKAKQPKASLMATVRKSVAQQLAEADALRLLDAPQQKVVATLLQAGVDPKDPAYKSQTGKVVDVLEKLKEDFDGQKSDADKEFEGSKKACADMTESLTGKIKENADAIQESKKKIESLKTKTAQAKEDMVKEKEDLKTNQKFLEDLTARCETGARQWDQRSTLRGEEMEAITKALEILKNEVKPNDVTKGLLLQQTQDLPPPAASAGVLLPASAALLEDQVLWKSTLSFLEVSSPREHMQRLLQEASRGQPAAVADDAQNGQVAALLGSEGRRLRSPALAALALKVTSAEPFDKVKEMITQMIARILDESKDEANKKSFCDTGVKLATQERDRYKRETDLLSTELSQLEAKKASMKEKMDKLGASLKELNSNLAEATKTREDEKADNIEKLGKAKEAIKALKQAIEVLKVFYAKAGRAKVLLQHREDPTYEPGAYTGQQKSATSILGLLQEIKADFEQTVQETEKQESEANSKYQKLARTTKGSISENDTGMTLLKQDTEAADTKMAQDLEDLKTQQDLLDGALKELDDLKPACADTGMSYSERVAKREEEVAVLKKALCYLDPSKEEGECE